MFLGAAAPSLGLAKGKLNPQLTAPLLPSPSGVGVLVSLLPSHTLLALPRHTEAPAGSAWLEGALPTKPIRSAADKTQDPINFSGRADLLARQPFFTQPSLFRWSWH